MTPPDRNKVSNLLSSRYSPYANITKNAVHVMNMPWVPPIKTGYEITLLSIEMMIRKRGTHFVSSKKPRECNKV